MNLSKQTLEEYLAPKVNMIAYDPEYSKELMDFIWEHHNIPKDQVSNWIMGRSSLNVLSEFDLFCLLEGLIFLKLIPETALEQYYTIPEIDYYEKAKSEDNSKDIFPIIIPAIQINNDQWIGKITVAELIRLRNAQLIYYNINAQRALKRVVKGDTESYKITLNKKAVKSIKEKFEEGSFISNTITLNIPDDPEENEFYYDEKKKEIVINRLNHFDITDGYHRYQGISQAYDNNPKLDYNMEVRIISFPVDKVQRFIFQEDHKTKMSRIAAETFDTEKAANQIAERINENMQCILKGMIRRDVANWNRIDFSLAIDMFFGKKVKGDRAHKALQIVKISKELAEKLNGFISDYPDYLDKGNVLNMMIMFCGFSRNESNERILNALQKGQGIKLYKTTTGRIGPRVINQIEKLYPNKI